MWQTSAAGDRLRVLGTAKYISPESVKLQCKLHKKCGIPLRIVDLLDTVGQEIERFFKYGAALPDNKGAVELDMAEGRRIRARCRRV